MLQVRNLLRSLWLVCHSKGPVTVGFVEKPDIVWVSMDSPREELMDKLEESKLTKLTSVQVGCVAATIFSEDEALYRVSVLSVSGTQVEVRYCDYGNKEMKGVDELFKLPDDLASHEELAVRVRVEGVKGVGDSSKNRARVEKKLSVDGLMVKLVKENEEFVASFEVGGKKIKFSKSKDVTGESKGELPVENKKVESEVKTALKKSDNSVESVAVPKPRTEEPTKVCESNEVKMKNEAGSGDAPNKEVKDVLTESGVKDPVIGVTGIEKSESTEEKVLKSSNRIVLYSELPNLKLLEGVEISGTVVYVSPLGGVWFCPQWIQGPLDTLTVQVDGLAVEKKLVTMCRSSIKEGILCIARSSQDGELYRARIACIEKNYVTVTFIDFGNSDLVTESEIFELPSGLEMLAPASAEVVLARELPKQNTQQVLEETLMEVSCMLIYFVKDLF